MKGGAWILLLAGGVGVAWLVMAQKKKKDAAALIAQQPAPPPPAAPKKKKKKKKKKDQAPEVPSPGFSFAGTVIGNCLFNGGPGVILEYEDGTTECVAAVDLTGG